MHITECTFPCDPIVMLCDPLDIGQTSSKTEWRILYFVLYHKDLIRDDYVFKTLQGRKWLHTQENKKQHKQTNSS